MTRRFGETSRRVFRDPLIYIITIIKYNPFRCSLHLALEAKESDVPRRFVNLTNLEVNRSAPGKKGRLQCLAELIKQSDIIFSLSLFKPYRPYPAS